MHFYCNDFSRNPYNDHGSNQLADSLADAHDDWQQIQTGFRADGGEKESGQWTIQGDAYKNDENQIVSPFWTATPPFLQTEYGEADASGANLQLSWERQIDAASLVSFKTYYDHSKREEEFLAQHHDIVDTELVYSKGLGRYHQLTAGLGYRWNDARYSNTFQAAFYPEHNPSNLYSAFIQDEIMLLPDTVWLTLGSKWEHNDLTGSELQPSARLLWKPDDTQTLWAAVSRAVRTPSQLENNGRIVVGMLPNQDGSSIEPITFQGNSTYDSEELIAYETGYRRQFSETFSSDLALFYHDYQNLVEIEILPPLESLEFRYANRLHGKGYGLELSAEWQAAAKWRLQLAYSYLNVDLSRDDGALTAQIYETSQDTSPTHQVSLRSSYTFNPSWQLNVWFRYVDRLQLIDNQNLQDGLFTIHAYSTLDANLIWKINDNFECKLAGQNLFNPSQLEYSSEYTTPRTRIERAAYAQLTWRF